jgi:hypothetical protein
MEQDRDLFDKFLTFLSHLIPFTYKEKKVLKTTDSPKTKQEFIEAEDTIVLEEEVIIAEPQINNDVTNGDKAKFNESKFNESKFS